MYIFIIIIPTLIFIKRKNPFGCHLVNNIIYAKYCDEKMMLINFYININMEIRIINIHINLFVLCVHKVSIKINNL